MMSGFQILRDARPKIICALTLVLFWALLRLGSVWSEFKPLWNDELYTQIYSVENISYQQIWRGQVAEGNNYPLFYSTQKMICDLAGFQLPFAWRGEWNVSDPAAQAVMRTGPNVCMALALTLIFYWSARKYSLAAGMCALLLGIGSPALWAYGAEARPYALWFALTTAQTLLFCRIISDQPPRILALSGWIGVNVLLCLTVSLGVVQTVLGSALLFLLSGRDLRLHGWATVLPVSVGMFYGLQAPRYVFNLPQNWPALVWDNFPIEYFLVFAAGMVVLWTDRKKQDPLRPQLGLTLLTIVMLMAACAIIAVLAVLSDPAHQRFEIASRYFVFLSPLSIMVCLMMAMELLNFFWGSRWVTVNVYVILGGLLILRLLRVLPVMAQIGSLS